jgi:TusA-related sulfurtransferase
MFGLGKRVEYLEEERLLSKLAIEDITEDVEFNNERILKNEEELNIQDEAIRVLAKTIHTMLNGCNTVKEIVNDFIPNALLDFQHLHRENLELKQRLAELSNDMEVLEGRIYSVEGSLYNTKTAEPEKSVTGFNHADLKPGDRIRVELKEVVEGSLLPKWLKEVGGVATIESTSYQYYPYKYRVTVGEHKSCGLNEDEIVGRAD